MKIKDPIVDEIHKIREKIDQKCNNDMKKIGEFFRKDRENYRDRIVTKKQVLSRKKETA